MSLSIPSASLSQRYIEPLLAGDRASCRQIIEHALFSGIAPYELLTGLIWPIMEQIQEFYREDKITRSQLNLASRLNRSITDQISATLPRQESKNKKVLIFCGNDEPEELGGQITADLFEADGWTTRFAGGGVPEDEVLKLIGDYRPDLVVMFATLPAGVPAVRKLIDYLRDVNSCPDMQVMCCGGIYKRAEGLADEIGADLYAADAAEAVRTADRHPTRKATVDQQTVGRTRRSRKAAARKAAGPQRTPAGINTTPDEE
jgi:MerR family transcriptional regulator, light-induced transcriptional regulator